MKTFGKYDILEEIGKGGFATVYHARDRELDRDVALKVLDPLLMRDPVWVKRFKREARAVARFRHPHIVTIYEIEQAEGVLYIAMELAQGGNLDARIQQLGRLSWEETVRLVGELADALDYAHDKGVLHRDLKPANILLDEETGSLLTDFGFVRILADNSMSVSLSGGVVGTPEYIAPEVWKGEEVTARTDIYALGCIVYEMLTGKQRFTGKTSPAVMMAHFNPPPWPEAWPEDTPPGIVEVLARAMAQDPEERYETAGELAADLAALTIDQLAAPYAELEAAVAAGQWREALTLADEIKEKNPDYRDVAGLEEKALAGMQQAAREAQAVQWQEAAQEALDAGDLDAAEVAIGQWLALLPGDEEALAMQKELVSRKNYKQAVVENLDDNAVGNHTKKILLAVTVAGLLVILIIVVSLTDNKADIPNNGTRVALIKKTWTVEGRKTATRVAKDYFSTMTVTSKTATSDFLKTRVAKDTAEAKIMTATQLASKMATKKAYSTLIAQKTAFAQATKDRRIAITQTSSAIRNRTKATLTQEAIVRKIATAAAPHVIIAKTAHIRGGARNLVQYPRHGHQG